MSIQELEAKVRESLTTKKDLNDLLSVFTQFKDQGGLQTEAKAVCQKLYVEFYDEDEERYNLMLDISDYVYGWGKSIWPDSP